MRRLLYLSHPEVVIDPSVPVPDWPLSEKGRARVVALAESGCSDSLAAIFSSPERKAQETAALIADPRALKVQIHPGLAEVDRSATGYLPFAEHEAYADRLFEAPGESAGGWETALDAQGRVMRAIHESLGSLGEAAGDVLIVGHGAVGSLAWCEIAARSISRSEDQPADGGCIWAAHIAGKMILPEHPWRRLETFLPG